MAPRTTPGIGLASDYNLGENGWKEGMDANLLKLSVLVNACILEFISSLPSVPAEGAIYIVTTGGNANRLAVRDKNSWVFFTPKAGYRIFCLAETETYVFTGSAWEPESAEGVVQYNLTNASPNNVTASANSRLDLTKQTLAWFLPAANNTGPMTLSVNGEVAKPLVDFQGNPLAADYVIANTPTLIRRTGTEYRLWLDHRFYVLSAQTLTARDQTLAARTEVFTARDVTFTARDDTFEARDIALEAKDDAVMAAEASGDIKFFDTKAAATAALGTLPDLQIVRIFRDESRADAQATYRVEAGALVFKLDFDDSVRRVVDYSLLPIMPLYRSFDEGDAADAFEMFIKAGSGKRLMIPKGTYHLDRLLSFGPEDVEDCEIDFCNSTIVVDAIRTEGVEFDVRYGALSFWGELSGSYYDQVLEAEAIEGQNSWAVTDSAGFEPGAYYWVQVAPSSTLEADHIVDKMLRCVRIETGLVYFDYRRGYAVPAGQTVRFTKVTPVKGVKVKNAHFVYGQTYTDTPQGRMDSSSGLTFNYAAGCDAENITYADAPKRTVQLSWVHDSVVERCEVLRTATPAREGYTVGIMGSIFVEAKKCKGLRDRHILDFTGSAFCRAIQCSEGETLNATFTTHGKWEHDLVYEGCEGHLQFAGSGATFGNRARNISIRSHSGPQLIARTGVTDMTVENSKFVSISDLNLDGLVCREVYFGNQVTFKKATSLSKRKNSFENCHVTIGGNALFDAGVEAEVFFSKCAFPNVFSNMFTGRAKVHLEDCEFETGSSSGAPIVCGLELLEVIRGNMSGANMILSDSLAQKIALVDVDLDCGSRPNTLSMFNIAKPAGELDFSWRGGKSVSNGARHITAITAGAKLKFRLNDIEYQNGSLRIDHGTLSAGSGGYLAASGLIFDNVARTLPPPSAQNVSYGNMIGALDLSGSGSATFAEIPAGSTAFFNISVIGAQVGDFVDAVAPGVDLGDDLQVSARVNADDQVRVALYNRGAGPVTPPASTHFRVLVRKLTP